MQRHPGSHTAYLGVYMFRSIRSNRYRRFIEHLYWTTSELSGRTLFGCHRFPHRLTDLTTGNNIVVYHQSLGRTTSARSRSYILLIQLLMWRRKTSLRGHTSISLHSTVLFTGRERFIIIQLSLRILREDHGHFTAVVSSARAKHSYPI